jgi:hypothetical protein
MPPKLFTAVEVLFLKAPNDAAFVVAAEMMKKSRNAWSSVLPSAPHGVVRCPQATKTIVIHKRSAAGNADDTVVAAAQPIFAMTQDREPGRVDPERTGTAILGTNDAKSRTSHAPSLPWLVVGGATWPVARVGPTANTSPLSAPFSVAAERKKRGGTEAAYFRQRHGISSLRQTTYVLDERQ